MFRQKQGNIFRVLAILIGCAFGPNAGAVFIPTFDFEVTAVFDLVPPSPQYTPASGGTTSTPTLLSWGTSTGFGQSSLGIQNSNVVGTVTTNDLTPTLTQTFVHTNNPITGNTLDSVRINIALELSWTTATTLPPPGTLVADNRSFLVNFQETPNTAPCVVGGPANPCPDIFVLSGNLNVFSFIVDEFEYNVSILPPTALAGLPQAACEAAGVLPPFPPPPFPACIGFTTEEGFVTNAPFAFVITTERLGMPEPGSLALLGAVLLGLAAVRRRRRS